MALTTRMKAGIDLRELQTRVKNCSTLEQEKSSKTIQYRTDEVNLSSALAGMGGSKEAVGDLRVMRRRMRARAPRAIASLPPEVAQIDALHVARAIQRLPVRMTS